jgi:hypothetical protein
VDFHAAPHFCIGSWKNPAEAEIALANARLIASAPDMFAVLQMLFTCDISNSDYQARLMDRARDAIKKATHV